jgi:hypothetical protein
MLKVINIILIGSFVFAVAAMRIARYFGFERWQACLGLIGTAIFLYVLNIMLIKYFVKKRTPDFASTEDVFSGVQKWELTAGIGIVPKWVSVIRLLSISALITGVLPWIIALLKSWLKALLT